MTDEYIDNWRLKAGASTINSAANQVASAVNTGATAVNNILEGFFGTRSSVSGSSFSASAPLMDDAIITGTAYNKVLRYFNRMLLGYGIDVVGEYSPDINGFVFIFMLPPHLSGYKQTTDQSGTLGKIAKSFAFMGLDFTPPPTTVITSSIPSRSGAINYGAEVEASGQLQITFLDNDKLNVFGYHKTWVNYIEDVSRGTVSPSAEYMDSEGDKFGEIDYATSAYVARFRPTSSSFWGDLVYIGKAIGIFPIALPDKEVIGRRDSNEITMLPITYSCTFYRQCVYGSPVETNGWIFQELQDQILSAYDDE